MRNLVYVILLFVSMGYAQDVAVADDFVSITSKGPTAELSLKKEDFRLLNGRMSVSDFNYQIRNEADTNTVLVSVVCQLKAFNEIGVDRINEMIRFANGKVHSSFAKERYAPSEIRMSYNPQSKDWSLTDLFTLEAADGQITTNLLSVDFDANGKFVVMKRVF